MVKKPGGYMGDPEITGEHEIDIGLRKRPLRERFIAGPLLLRDVVPVARMPGKVLALWLLIRHRSDLHRGRPATLPPGILREWGIHKRARAAALQRLVQAGLINIERPKGHMLKVKVLKRRSGHQ